MEFLRTPEARFAGLPGYDFAPSYAQDLPGYGGLRMHYLDLGPKDGPVALCLHGQPAWSYLYRKFIPPFLAAGYRVVAPDLFGFGRSDKPVEESVYSFTFHRGALAAVIAALDLRNITLVCQDWGGLLGLTLPMDSPERFKRLLVMNTMLATGDVPLTEGFLAWRAFNNRSPDMDIAGLFRRGTPGISAAEADAYAAPYPDARYKAGVRRFPNLVADHPQAEGAALARQARDWWQTAWQGQSFMAIGKQDPVLASVMPDLRAHIKGCPEPLEIADAGHFVQEAGAVIVERALAAWGG